MMPYIKLFVDYLDAIEPLGDAERGRLFTALMQYARTGEAPRLGGNERFLFPMMRAQIDRDNQDYQDYRDRQGENGKKGGRPRKNPENPPLSEKPAVFSKTQKSQEKDKEKDEGKDISPQPPKSETHGFGPELSAAFDDWLRYKREKRQEYKPTGLQSLITQVRNKAAVYGEAAVAQLIRECMSANWQGIIWDRLDRAPKNKNPERPKGDTAWMKEYILQRGKEEP